MELKIEYVDIDSIKPYENNPRHNEEAIPYVMNSIKEFGFKNPIIIDKNNVIIAGHTRLESAKRLGMKEVPIIHADDLTEEQVKAFRLADNKVSEKAEWNFELLDEELASITQVQMNEFGFILQDLEEVVDELENLYTTKINIPTYEVNGDEPTIEEMLDESKTNELIKEINKLNIDETKKEFLRKTATRHYTFNYSNIAEYYAHQNKEVQEIMEKLALVIVDIKSAITNGYVELSNKLEEMLNDET